MASRNEPRHGASGPPNRLLSTKYDDDKTKARRTRRSPSRNSDQGSASGAESASEAGDAGHKMPKKRERAKKKRLFALAHEKQPAYVLPDDYEHRYPPDDYGEEMGPNARVWRVYLDEADLNDHGMVEEWKDGIDALLVFAGLFSAVVTTFVTQTAQKLDVDYGQLSASLLTELVALQRGIMNGSPSQDIPISELNFSSSPRFSSADAWVNGLWFISLSLSLVVALAVVLIKQWIQQYVSFVSGTPQERARIHHFRYIGLQRWSIPMIIGILPSLLHAALFLFFLGLVIFLHTLNIVMASLVGLVGGGMFALYLASSALPAFYPQCPYRTPVIEHLRPIISLGVFTCRRIIFLFTHRAIPQVLSYYWVTLLWRGPLIGVRRWCFDAFYTSPPSYDSKTFKISESEAALKGQDEIVTQLIQWLLSSPSNPSVKPIALQAISGLRFGFSCMGELLGQGSWVQQELLHELQNQCDVFELHRLFDEFIGTPAFYVLERMLRASMFIPSTDHPSGLPIIGMPISLQHIVSYKSDTKLAMVLTTYLVESARYNESAPDILRALCDLTATADRYPMVWRAWFDSLSAYPHVLHSPLAKSAGAISAYDHLRPLFKTLLDSPTPTAWAAVLPFVHGILSPSFPTITSEFDIPMDLDEMPKKALSLRVHGFCTGLLKAVAIECGKDPQKVADAEEVIVAIMEGLLRLSISEPSMDALLHETSGELFQLSFFANDHWNFATYHSAFALYLNPYQNSNFWSQPLALLSPQCLPRILLCMNSTRALLQPVYLEDAKVNAQIMSGVASYLYGAGRSREVEGMMRNVLNVVLELHKPYEPAENILDQAREWHVHLQPLMRCVLWFFTTQDEPGNPQISLPLRSLFDTLTNQVDIFTYICSTFFFYGNRSIRVTFGQDSEILLQFARYLKTKEGILDLWRDLLTWVIVQSTKLRLEEHRHRHWDRGDFDRYGRMADFVDQLVSALEMGDGEFELLRFEGDYVKRVLENRLQSSYTPKP